jgi:hypothetical protein
MGLLEKADHDYEMYRDDGHMWGVPHTKRIGLPKYKHVLKVRKEYHGSDGWKIVVKSYDTDVAWGWEHVGTLAEHLGMVVKNIYDENAKKVNRYK